MSATVSIVRGKEPDKMVMEVLRLLGGLESIVSGQNAVIKPNLGPWFPKVVPKFVNRWAKEHFLTWMPLHSSKKVE